MASPLGNTLLLGLGTASAALVLAVACLELRRDGFGWAALMRIAALPLLVPQIAFQFGAQVLLVRLRLDGGLTAVAWMHLLFVFPYVLIALADPWAALDRRYGRAAAALGASRWRTLVGVKLPILLRPLLVAGAIGFAVSVAQYLPTLFAGGGRVATLTTEAVTLSSGGDRRVVGILAFLQSALPLIVYVAALRLPGLVHPGRANLK